MSKKQQAFENKNALSDRSATINDIRLVESYIDGLKYHLIRADQAIIRSRRFLEQAMKHYIQSRKERMMIDRLREKAFEEFKVEQARLDQIQLDDLSTMRARLKSAPGVEEEEVA